MVNHRVNLAFTAKYFCRFVLNSTLIFFPENTPFYAGTLGICNSSELFSHGLIVSEFNFGVAGCVVLMALGDRPTGEIIAA